MPERRSDAVSHAPGSEEDRRPSRRRFLHDAGVVEGSRLSGPRPTRTDAASNHGFTFVNISDPHIGHHEGAEETLRRALEGAQSLGPRPAFLLITGDLTEGEVEEYRTFRDIVSRAGVPVHVLPGNHDVGNRMSERNLPLLERYRDEVGRDFYSFTAGPPGDHVLFIVLNSLFLRTRGVIFRKATRRRFRREVQDQWDFLEGELARSVKGLHPARSVFLCLHHMPCSVYSKTPAAGYLLISRSARRRILALSERYHIQAVLSGHAHFNYACRKGRTALVTTPSVSYNSPLSADGKLPLGFRTFHVGREGFAHRYKSLDLTGLERFRVVGVRQHHSDGAYVGHVDGEYSNPRALVIPA